MKISIEDIAIVAIWIYQNYQPKCEDKNRAQAVRRAILGPE
jgi:hypothetical protein